MERDDALDAPDMVETEDGRVLIHWPSGHVEGPYDADDIARFYGAAVDAEAPVS